MRPRAPRLALLPVILFSLAAAAGAAEGLRTIASETVTTYFNGDWRLETTDVLLGRAAPWLTLQGRITRVDTGAWSQHTFAGGPIVSLSDTVYAFATYGLGLDSAGALTHELDTEIDYETETNTASLGLKANWFPSTGYAYYLPSVAGKFHPTPALGLFGKFFLSVDTDYVLTESFWGQADYRFSPSLAALAGFTVSMAKAIGYSFIAGIEFDITPEVALKYSLQYLSDTVEYLDEPQPRSGLVNTLVLDVKF